jgi:glycosidase
MLPIPRPDDAIPDQSCIALGPGRYGLNGAMTTLLQPRAARRPRDFEVALAKDQSLEPFLRRLNEIRKLHPALRQMRTITFHHIDNDALLAYSKCDPDTCDCVPVVVTLNAFGAEEGTLWLDMAALGMEWYDRFWVRDESPARNTNGDS